MLRAWSVNLSVLAAMAVLVGGAGQAAAVTISFDEIPAGNSNEMADVITDEYAHLGAVFNSDGRHGGVIFGGIGNGDPGNWQLEGSNGSQFLGFNDSGRSCLLEFAVPVMDVSLDLGRGYDPGVVGFTVRAYGASGLLQTVTVSAGASSFDWTTIHLSPEDITWVEWEAQDNYGVDNIRFTPTAVVPEPLTLAGLAIGTSGLGVYLRRRKAARR